MARPVAITEETRQKVIELKRGHSYAEVAKLLGISVSSCKAIVIKAGANNDNPHHAALFKLPEPVKQKQSTEVAVQVRPPLPRDTGHQDLNSLLYIREIIKTGDLDLIEQARKAFALIENPKRLENIYSDWLIKNDGSMFSTFASWDCSDIESLIKKTLETKSYALEAAKLFDLNANPDMLTEADNVVASILKPLKPENAGLYDDDAIAKLFKQRPDVMPHNLTQCLSELAFWNHLYHIRHSLGFIDSPPESFSRECFIRELLTEIRPRDKEEALMVANYAETLEGFDDSYPWRLMRNLANH